MKGVAGQAAALRPGRVALRRRQLDRQAGETRIGGDLALEQHHGNPLARQGRVLAAAEPVLARAARQEQGEGQEQRARVHWGAASASCAGPATGRDRAAGHIGIRRPAERAQQLRGAAAEIGRRARVVDQSRQGRAGGRRVAGAQLRQRAQLERAVAPGIVRSSQLRQLARQVVGLVSANCSCAARSSPRSGTAWRPCRPRRADRACRPWRPHHPPGPAPAPPASGRARHSRCRILGPARRTPRPPRPGGSGAGARSPPCSARLRPGADFPARRASRSRRPCRRPPRAQRRSHRRRTGAPASANGPGGRPRRPRE